MVVFFSGMFVRGFPHTAKVNIAILVHSSWMLLLLFVLWFVMFMIAVKMSTEKGAGADAMITSMRDAM